MLLTRRFGFPFCVVCLSVVIAFCHMTGHATETRISCGSAISLRLSPKTIYDWMNKFLYVLSVLIFNEISEMFRFFLFSMLLQMQVIFVHREYFAMYEYDLKSLPDYLWIYSVYVFFYFVCVYVSFVVSIPKTFCIQKPFIFDYHVPSGAHLCAKTVFP